MGRESKRDQLLLAVGRVVRRDGADGLTLEAVAAEAGVSKGGLLYHFASKDELVAGLIARLLGNFEARLNTALLAEPQPSPGRFTRAYLKASLKGDADEDAVSAALVSAVAHAPQLLQPLHDAYRQWNAQLDADGLQEGVSLLVRLAIDGLWFSELIGLGPPRAASRKALVRQLHRLVTP